MLRPKARIRRTFLVYDVLPSFHSEKKPSSRVDNASFLGQLLREGEDACWHQLKACPGAVLTAGREVCVAERKSHDMHEF